MNTNKVAKIFKVYAIINAVVVGIASIVIAAAAEQIVVFIIGVAVGIFINFLLYACGNLCLKFLGLVVYWVRLLVPIC